MDAAPGTPRSEPDVLIRPLRVEDLPAADAIRRLAFGTFLGLPDPMSFEGDASSVRTRYLADPTGCFAAELDGELVGTNFAVDWGSVGFFGPLTIHPDHWGRGIAQRLVEVVLEGFTRRGTRHVGLFTFAHSPKHLALYQKFGFWPRFTTAIMAKPVRPVAPGPTGRPTRSCRPHGNGHAWRTAATWPTPCTRDSILAERSPPPRSIASARRCCCGMEAS